MNKLGGFTQDQLNKIWDDFDSNNSELLAQKNFDDIEQVMSIKSTEGLVIVSRKDNGKTNEQPQQY